jgi:hypothetical protein
MRNLCITLIIVLVVPAVWFSSCAKVDDYEGAGKTEQFPTSDSTPMIHYFLMESYSFE